MELKNKMIDFSKIESDKSRPQSLSFFNGFKIESNGTTIKVGIKNNKKKILKS